MGNRKKEILKVASRLFNIKGYKGSSIQEIADIIGINKSTFFHYFKSKEDLLMEILNVAVDEPIRRLKIILADTNLSPEERLRRAIAEHLSFGAKYLDNVNIYHRELRHLSVKNRKTHIALRKSYASYLELLIKDIKKTDEKRFKGLDPKIVTFAILGMCNWTYQWYKKEGTLSIEDISNIFYQMIIQSSGCIKDSLSTKGRHKKGQRIAEQNRERGSESRG